MTDQERLWSRVAKGGEDDCWPFGDGRHYGYIGVAGRKVLAHRLVYETMVRPLRAGEVVRHTCDNPPCCNPGHLRAGTQTENMADMKERGRARYVPARGASNGNARLVDEQVIAMRCAHVLGAPARTLAVMFGVSSSLVHRIVTGRAWIHLPMPVRIPRFGPGLCGCGCGTRAPVARITNRRLGHVKGQPTRFVRGHSGRRLHVGAETYHAGLGGERDI